MAQAAAQDLWMEVLGMEAAEWEAKRAARAARFAALLAEEDVAAVDYGWEGVQVAEHVLAA